MLRFQRLQLTKKAVVLGIGNKRRVERVVLIVMPLDLIAQRSRPLADLTRHGHENSRSARSLPGDMPRASILACIDCSCCRIARTAFSLKGTRLSSTSV